MISKINKLFVRIISCMVSVLRLKGIPLSNLFDLINNVMEEDQAEKCKREAAENF